MKKSLIIFTLVTFFTGSLMAQAPETIAYQAVVRNHTSGLVINANISLRVSIVRDSENGTIVFQEIHQTTTNKNGLLNIEIGNGVTLLSSISEIDWSKGPYYIKTEIDLLGGSNYTIHGSYKLLSAPYALFAKHCEKCLDGADCLWKKNGDDIYYETGKVGINTKDPFATLHVNNTNPTIEYDQNTAIAQFSRIYQGSETKFLIYGYPDTDKMPPYLRKAVMLYATQDATDLIICANKEDGNVRFFTQSWTRPSSERMRIDYNGNVGIGTINPKSRLQVTNGDIYIENVNAGVIMKSPNGQCWKMTVQNDGSPSFTSVTCP